MTSLSELTRFAANISPKLSENGHWVRYSERAIRNGQVTTLGEVNALGYGFEAGTRERVW